jgi:hypothetical protein
MTMAKHSGITVHLGELAQAVLLDLLDNIARQLESGVDPLRVAQQIRAFTAAEKSDVREELLR